MSTATPNSQGKGTSGAKATARRVGDRELHIERVFAAPRDRVWEAYTDPKLLAQWWGRGNRLTVEKFELLRGGHWRLVEHSDGGEHGFEGRFRDVKAPELIEMTFEWDGMPGYPVIEQYRFEEMSGGRTKLVATSRFFSAEELQGMMDQGMESGMNESYEALDRVLAAM